MNQFQMLREMAKDYKERYPKGTRVEVINMNDPYSPVPSGTRGTVTYVDDMASIHVNWDNGRTLALIPGEDSFKKVDDDIGVGKERVADFGDECQIVLPKKPVDCSKLGFFDELEEGCWNLVKGYCAKLGVEILPNEDGDTPISYDVAKEIQDKVLEKLQDAGVELDFGDDVGESEVNEPEMGM